MFHASGAGVAPRASRVVGRSGRKGRLPGCAMLMLAALLGLGLRAVPGHAQAAEAGPPELFASVADAERAPVSAEQARQLATYRSERGATEVSVVRLRTDVMKSAGAVTLNLPAAPGVPLDVVRVTRRSAAKPRSIQARRSEGWAARSGARAASASRSCTRANA